MLTQFGLEQGQGHVVDAPGTDILFLLHTFKIETNRQLYMSRDMNTVTSEDELKAAIEFQIRLQIQALERQEDFHKCYIYAEIVGEGHRNAMNDIQLKIKALDRCRKDYSLLTEQMKTEALHAYRDFMHRLKMKEAEQEKMKELQKQKEEEDIRKAISDIASKGFGLQPAGVPSRNYIRDINC